MHPQATFGTKVPEPHNGYLYALIISLTLFASAFVLNIAIVFLGVLVLSRAAFAVGWVGVIYGLLLMFSVSWFSNHVVSKVIPEAQQKRLNRIKKTLEYCGYGFVVWSIIGFLLVLGAGV